jgi:hypothetical protein
MQSALQVVLLALIASFAPLLLLPRHHTVSAEISDERPSSRIASAISLRLHSHVVSRMLVAVQT